MTGKGRGRGGSGRGSNNNNNNNATGGRGGRGGNTRTRNIKTGLNKDFGVQHIRPRGAIVGGPNADDANQDL